MRDALKATELFADIPKNVWYKDWVIHCKPVGNGLAVLKYFAPYVFRVAISNRRLIKIDNDQVTFIYKHPKTKQWKPVILHVFEFMRRFLQHVLPKGFKKIRHYGLLSSHYKQVLATLQYKLGTVEAETDEDETTKSAPKIPHCPVCNREMMLVGILPPEYSGIQKQYVPP